MADLITLTHQPIRLNTAQKQAIYLATDVGGYDVIDIICSAVFEGSSPTVTIKLITGMQAQTDDGWVDAGTFGTLNPTPTPSAKITIGGGNATNPGFLRFLRWEVTALGGTSPFATFFIRGMARTLA
jgi:hypothetical protein